RKSLATGEWVAARADASASEWQRALSCDRKPCRGRIRTVEHAATLLGWVRGRGTPSRARLRRLLFRLRLARLGANDSHLELGRTRECDVLPEVEVEAAVAVSVRGSDRGPLAFIRDERNVEPERFFHRLSFRSGWLPFASAFTQVLRRWKR